MKYVVTGAAGIGRHVSAELMESGHEVVGVDAFTEPFDASMKRADSAWLAAHTGFEGVERDLAVAPRDKLLDAADAVIRLAAQPGARLSWADSFHIYVGRNLAASHQVLEAARRTRVPRPVLASSSSVWGRCGQDA